MQPGWVYSAHDEDKHFIDVPTLVKLVGLREGEFVVDRREKPLLSRYYDQEDLIVIAPKFRLEGYDRLRLLVERKRLENDRRSDK